MSEGNGTARVLVKFYGPLKQYVGAVEQTAETAAGTTVRTLILELGVPREHLVYTMCLANDRRVPLDTPVVDGDKLDVFQPVAGG